MPAKAEALVDVFAFARVLAPRCPDLVAEVKARLDAALEDGPVAVLA